MKLMKKIVMASVAAAVFAPAMALGQDAGAVEIAAAATVFSPYGALTISS